MPELLTPQSNNLYPVQPEITHVDAGGSIAIDPSKPLFNEGETEGRGLLRGTIVADIKLQEHFSPETNTLSLLQIPIRDKRTGEVSSKLLLVPLHRDQDGNEGYNPAETIDVKTGKDTLSEEAVAKMGLIKRLAGAVSISHGYDGAVHMTNNRDNVFLSVISRPGAATNYEADQPVGNTWAEHSDSWDYTVHSKQAFGEFYKNHPQIGKDSRIEGGVYVTSDWKGNVFDEAIVVDVSDAEDKAVYEGMLSEVRKLRDVKQGIGRTESTLLAVYDVVDQALPYSMEGVDGLLNKLKPDGNGKFFDGTKVSLLAFVKAKTGVCRHQALLAAKLMEMLHDVHELDGQVSVDRNRLWKPLTGEQGGHAWARYTDTNGEVYIVDVAQEVRARKLKDASGEEWHYRRDEDKQKAAGSLAVKSASH